MLRSWSRPSVQRVEQYEAMIIGAPRARHHAEPVLRDRGWTGCVFRTPCGWMRSYQSRGAGASQAGKEDQETGKVCAGERIGR